MSDEYSEDDSEDDDQEPLSVEELKQIAADWRCESAERLRACVAVWRDEPAAGRDLLLALSIDLDADEEDRFNALERLVGMDASTIAAVSWLMWQTEWGHLEGMFKGEAASVVPGFKAVQASLADGLALVVADPYLDDLYRIWAGAHRVVDGAGGSIAELRALFKDNTIVDALDEVAQRDGQTSRGVLVGETALGWIVDDDALPPAMRFEAAERISSRDERGGADAFEKLATDPNLDQDYWLRAAEELASIDPRMTFDGVKHDTTELEELLGGIQRRLRVIVHEDRLAELGPIWKRRGWTTPAEFYLVGEALRAISEQVDDLERQVNVVVRGADMVGRR